MIIDIYRFGDTPQDTPNLISYDESLFNLDTNFPVDLEGSTLLGILPQLLTPGDCSEIPNGYSQIISWKEKSSEIRELRKRAAQAVSAIGRIRRPIIDKYDVFSEENFCAVKLQNYVEHLSRFLDDVVDNKESIGLYGHNKKSKTQKSGNPIIQRSDQVILGFITLDGAQIDSVDVETGTYMGKIKAYDWIEKISAGGSFICHKVPDFVDSSNFVNPWIRPTQIHLTDYHFTSLLDLEENFRDYIRPLVLEVEKSLKESGSNLAQLPNYERPLLEQTQ